jgi:hypothetical protein
MRKKIRTTQIMELVRMPAYGNLVKLRTPDHRWRTIEELFPKIAEHASEEPIMCRMTLEIEVEK